MQFKRILLIIAFFSYGFTCLSQERPKYLQSGIASYYSDKFQGRKTASGEKFDQGKFTAAHKSLPFGTWVKVVNLQNKRSVIVRINDRGPFVKGRIIDLSKSAAKEIGSLSEGIFQVRIYEYRKDKDTTNLSSIYNCFIIKLKAIS